MSLLTRRSLPAAILLIAVATAQTCYYPDGKTISKDLPCDSSASGSACCGANSFCLAGGLCYSGGLVTRGSCTDQTWGSSACAGYCKSVEKSGEVAITPCTSNDGSNEFVCGVNTTACQTGTGTFTLSDDASIVLRPNQIAQLVSGALATTGPQHAADCEDGFSAGTLAGVAVGIAVPLLIALGIMYLLLRREQRRFSKPKLMYKLPDEITREDFTFTPPPPLRTTAAFSSRRSSNTSRGTNAGTIASRRASMRTTTTASTMSPRPTAAPTFLERYNAMKSVADAQVMAKEHSYDYASQISPRHELASPMPSPMPKQENARYELSDTRMSKD